MALFVAVVRGGGATNSAERGGMGIFRTEGIDCWFHGGFWGTLAMYCPSLQTGFAAAGMNPESSDGLESIVVRALERQLSCQP